MPLGAFRKGSNNQQINWDLESWFLPSILNCKLIEFSFVRGGDILVDLLGNFQLGELHAILRIVLHGLVYGRC